MEENLQQPQTTEETVQSMFDTGGGPLTERIEKQKQSERILLIVIRGLFLVLLASLTTLTVWSQSENPDEIGLGTLLGIVISTMAVGFIVISVDYLTPNKRLTAVVGVYLGICVGLLGAIAVARLIDVVALAWNLEESNVYLNLAKVITGIVLCYLAVSFVLTTKDDFRLVIPYVEFAKQIRGIRPLVLDTSVLIDGRIDSIIKSGFVDAPMVIPTFVVEELQALSDSRDRLKRARGRRGLDMVGKLQANGIVDVSIDDIAVPGHSVDRMLVEMALTHQMRILTTDYNLLKVAKINGATALNVNDLAAGLKTVVAPGESIMVEVVKEGENEGQGVAYMPDGTMIVIEGGASHIGNSVQVTVSNALQTSAGKLIFANLDAGSDDSSSVLESVQSSATNQPKYTEQPQQGNSSDSDNPRTPKNSRNPRR